jgi:hypothetical protein
VLSPRTLLSAAHAERLANITRERKAALDARPPAEALPGQTNLLAAVESILLARRPEDKAA